MTLSTLASLTAKVARPAASVVEEIAVIVEEPEPAASETALPGTAFPFASFSVTVIVEVVEPSATTLPGLELAVEMPALTVPGESVTSKD